MNEKSTVSIAPEVAEGFESPPRFTREMAENGRHAVGTLVLREARGRGRPPKAEGERKEKVTLRLSPEVLSFFRAGGEGWQTRLDEVLLAHARAAGARRREHGLMAGGPGLDLLIQPVSLSRERLSEAQDAPIEVYFAVSSHQDVDHIVTEDLALEETTFGPDVVAVGPVKGKIVVGDMRTGGAVPKKRRRAQESAKAG